jgi:hypothetical protein
LKSVIRKIESGRPFWVTCIKECEIMSLFGHFVFKTGEKYKVYRLSEETSNIARRRFMVDNDFISSNFRFAGFVKRREEG